MVLSGLPEPRNERLAHAPLSLVVCQARHERNMNVGDPKKVLKVVDRLGRDKWRVEEQPAQELNMEAGPAGVRAAGTMLPAWRLTSDDGQWAVALHTDFFSLETASYTEWSDFHGLFSSVVKAVAAELDPSFDHRIGVRFVNEIRDIEGVASPCDWRPWINDRFLGPVLHESLVDVVDQARQVVELSGTEGTRAVIQHGAHSDDQGSSVYRLDIDCYTQRRQMFESAAVIETADTLHTFEKQLFELAITDKLYGHLGGQA